MLIYRDQTNVRTSFKIKEDNGAQINVTENHYGRDRKSLIGEMNDYGGTNVANWYENGATDSFFQKTWIPYVDQQLDTLGDAWDLETDENAPVKNMGQAESVVAKYANLNNTTGHVLAFGDALTIGAVNAEIQPYWEQMLIATQIAQIADSADQDRIYDDYIREGSESVKDILEKQEYTENPKVQWAYAHSATFLNLSEDQKHKYTSMSLEDQWDLIYVGDAQQEDYINENSDNGNTDIAYYEKFVERADAKASMNLDAKLQEFEQHLARTGVDYKEEFDKVFKEQTQSVDFSESSQVLQDTFMLYYGILDRIPDKEGYVYWLNDYHEKDENIELISQSFLDSAEFQSIVQDGADGAVTFEDTLDALYEAVLDRDPDQEGYDYWMDEYNNGGSAAGIAVSFARSEEFMESAEKDLYAFLTTEFGPNLRELPFAEVGLPEPEVQTVGTFDQYETDGYAGVML